MDEKIRMDTSWGRRLLPGVVLCVLLLGAGCTGNRESKVDETLAGLCKGMEPEDFNEMAAGFENTTPEEMKQFVTAIAGMQGQSVAEMSDDDARAMAERAAAQTRGFLRAMNSYCRLRASGEAPEPGLVAPPKGKLVIYGEYKAPSTILSEYDAEFNAGSCEKPFGLIMSITGDGKASGAAYIFCDSGGEFRFIRAYRKSAETAEVWKRFDDMH